MFRSKLGWGVVWWREKGERREKGIEKDREMREKKMREERTWKRKERGSRSHGATWTPHQNLTVILTPFDHFNSIDYRRG